MVYCQSSSWAHLAKCIDLVFCIWNFWLCTCQGSVMLPIWESWHRLNSPIETDQSKAPYKPSLHHSAIWSFAHSSHKCSLLQTSHTVWTKSQRQNWVQLFRHIWSTSSKVSLQIRSQKCFRSGLWTLPWIRWNCEAIPRLNKALLWHCLAVAESYLCSTFRSPWRPPYSKLKLFP